MCSAFSFSDLFSEQQPQVNSAEVQSILCSRRRRREVGERLLAINVNKLSQMSRLSRFEEVLPRGLSLQVVHLSRKFLLLQSFVNRSSRLASQGPSNPNRQTLSPRKLPVQGLVAVVLFVRVRFIAYVSTKCLLICKFKSHNSVGDRMLKKLYQLDFSNRFCDIQLRTLQSSSLTWNYELADYPRERSKTSDSTLRVFD